MFLKLSSASVPNSTSCSETVALRFCAPRCSVASWHPLTFHIREHKRKTKWQQKGTGLISGCLLMSAFLLQPHFTRRAELSLHTDFLKALQNLLYPKYHIGLCDPSWIFLGPNSWGEAMTGSMISSPITRYQSSEGFIFQVSRSQSFSVHTGEGRPHSAIAVQSEKHGFLFSSPVALKSMLYINIQ